MYKTFTSGMVLLVVSVVVLFGGFCQYPSLPHDGHWHLPEEYALALYLLGWLLVCASCWPRE